MLQMRHSRTLGTLVLFGALSFGARAESVKKVFVIAMENHNWTQPAQVPGKIQQIFQNANAPFINSLVNGTAVAIINGSAVDISQQVSYAAAYHNVLATPTGSNPKIHPSEPNYLWAEAGTNFGILNDNDPFKPATPPATGFPNDQSSTQHLSTFLTQVGKTWRSYQEDIDLTTVGGNLTNVPLPTDQYTVPLTSFSGSFAAGVNAFNGSPQYNYAAKHNPMVLFTDANGGDNATSGNPLAQQYAPLQQLFSDLDNDTVADYNWITPNQYNDMHTSLTGGYKGLTGDSANIKQGDDFLSQIVPVIMASKAYRNHGVIILWWDESESDGVAGDIADDFNHTIGEIIISQHAHENVNGLPYASPVNFTHSSDLRTMQEIFGTGGPFLGDAVNATDLSDLFGPGAIPKKP
jgi:phosphatidylinositol-3-phosphatase